jgi:hypothetical protein
MATKMWCELTVAGAQDGPDLKPEEVTRVLGIRPDESGHRGDPRGSKTPLVYKAGWWRIKTEISEDASLNEQIRLLLDRVDSQKESLKTLAVDCELEFGCVVYFDEHAPDLHIESDTLQAMAELGAHFDIDAYLYAYEWEDGAQ